ncbi:MAG: SPOR domain-containing protein [Vibrio sp.]
MANRDYVRKGNAPKSSNKSRSRQTKNNKSRKQQPKAKSFPWKIASIAAVLLVALSSLLWALSGDDDEAQSTDAQATAQVTPQPQAPKKEADIIPPPPKEKWDYVKSLPEREIKVQAKEQKVAKVPYVMQCGAYKTHSDAQKRKANIAFQGLSSKIVKQSGSSWYRVVLGPYKFKRQAVKDQHVLQRVKIEPCMIMQDYLKFLVK